MWTFFFYGSYQVIVDIFILLLMLCDCGHFHLIRKKSNTAPPNLLNIILYRPDPRVPLWDFAQSGVSPSLAELLSSQSNWLGPHTGSGIWIAQFPTKLIRPPYWFRNFIIEKKTDPTPFSPYVLRKENRERINNGRESKGKMFLHSWVAIILGLQSRPKAQLWTWHKCEWGTMTLNLELDNYIYVAFPIFNKNILHFQCYI